MALTVDEFIKKWALGCEVGIEAIHPRQMKADMEEMLKKSWNDGAIAKGQIDSFFSEAESIRAKEDGRS